MIFFACHKHPFQANDGRPRGAELSVQSIMRHLLSAGHRVAATAPGWRLTKEIEGVEFFPWGSLPETVGFSDLVITWGRVAHEAAGWANAFGVPYILMVRFWRNVCPLPAGDLNTREVPTEFVRRNEWMFRCAASVITNTRYSAEAIRRIYGREAVVSYVPIQEPSDWKVMDSAGGHLTIITPEIYGELELVAALSALRKYRFLVVNPGEQRGAFEALHSVTVIDYTADMDRDVWGRTSILLQPVYYNDICGTRRTTIEALSRSIPVVASDRCGMSEKVSAGLLVSRDADSGEWQRRIDEILENYPSAQVEARYDWERYDTAAQLEVFRAEVEKAIR